MAKIPFIVSARAGKLLGRENFSNPEGAIIELVKNSYDAYANRVKITFKKDEIIIADNGKGFAEGKKNGGNGLKNMKSRAEELNGILIINSTAEKGTTVQLDLPIT